MFETSCSRKNNYTIQLILKLLIKIKVLILLHKQYAVKLVSIHAINNMTKEVHKDDYMNNKKKIC